jgi:hypothetical protein
VDGSLLDPARKVRDRRACGVECVLCGGCGIEESRLERRESRVVVGPNLFLVNNHKKAHTYLTLRVLKKELVLRKPKAICK